MRVMSLTSQPSQPFSAFWTLLIPLPLIYVTLLKIVFKKCVSTWALKTRKIRLFGTSLNKAICHFLGNVIYYFEKKIEFYFDKKYFSNFISMEKKFFEFYFIEKIFFEFCFNENFFSNSISLKFFFSILFQWKKYFSNFFNDFFFWKSRWLSLRFFYCREQIQVANKPVFPSPYATPSTPPTRPNADECDGTHAQKMIEFWCRKWRAFWAFIHPPFLVSQSLTLIFYVFNFNHYNTIWPKIHKAINQT